MDVPEETVSALPYNGSRLPRDKIVDRFVSHAWPKAAEVANYCCMFTLHNFNQSVSGCWYWFKGDWSECALLNFNQSVSGCWD